MGEKAPEIWFPHLGIEIEHLDNVAFRVFGMDIYWYGIIICIGILAGIFLMAKEIKRTGQNLDDYTDMVIFGIIACIIGARLYYVIFSWDAYKDNLIKIFAFREGGLAIFGAVIVAVLVGIYFSKKRGMNFWTVADTSAPSILLGQIIGRWGNFFNREAYGGYTDNLFAMRYIASQAKDVPQSLMDVSIVERGVRYIQVHPTFLYESLWNLGTFIMLMLMKRNKRFKGQIIALYLIGYSAGRVWIEGLRVDQLHIGGTNIAVSQLLSAIIIVAGVFFIIWRIRSEKHEAEEETKSS